MGYTSQQYLRVSNASDALFRAWGSAVSAALTSMGWSMTADTGQVNWTTVTVPSSAYVYEIWQPGDAGTAFYLKLEYGYSSTSPRFQISLGTSTNGSGTLTGYTTTAQELSMTSNSAVPLECDFSGDTNRCGLVMNRNSVTQAACFAIERTKNVDGTDNNIGVSQFGHPFLTYPQQSIRFGVGAGLVGNTGSFVALADGQNQSEIFNSTVPFSPVFPNIGLYGNPQTVIGFVHNQDVANGGQFSTTLYGATRTYIRLGIQTALTWPAYCAPCLRYD